LMLTSTSEDSFCAVYYDDAGTFIPLGTFFFHSTPRGTP